MIFVAALLVLSVGGLMAWVRLAPSDPAHWQIDLANPRPAELAGAAAGSGPVRQLANGAYFDLTVAPDAAQALIARLDATAMATPRTRRIAGGVAEGHVTWETRSAFWGFPDYTTAEVHPGGLTVYARQRFGKHDFGVNAARLRVWLTALGQG